MYATAVPLTLTMMGDSLCDSMSMRLLLTAAFAPSSATYVRKVKR